MFIDYDGTLTDIMPTNLRIAKDLWERFKCDHIETIEDLRSHFDTMGVACTFKKMIPDAMRIGKSVEDILRLSSAFMAAPLFDDAKPSLQRLRDADFILILVSRASRDRLMREVEANELATFFDIICWETQQCKALNIVQTLQHHPLIAKKASMDGMYYIGDEVTDMRLSKMLKEVDISLTSIGVTRGLNSHEAMKKEGECYPSLSSTVDAILSQYHNVACLIDYDEPCFQQGLQCGGAVQRESAQQ